jgi:protein-S-isoprenylcysteine O-methyltransferase Ste14
MLSADRFEFATARGRSSDTFLYASCILALHESLITVHVMNRVDMLAAAQGAVGCLWLLWFVSWVIAARWTGQTVKTTRPGERTLEIFLSFVGGSALVWGAPALAFQRAERLYSLGVVPAWLLVGLVAFGFAFCWWARIQLGRTWSWEITLKKDHQVIDTGPYALVRHPIYTGLLLASYATAVAYGNALGFLGALLMTGGVYLKARREEDLLIDEIGQPYETYRRRVPMLVPRILGTPAPT